MSAILAATLGAQALSKATSNKDSEGSPNSGQFLAEMGGTALSGIFAARAAERARKQNLELMRDQSGLQVEQQKTQLQQNLLQGLSSNLAQIMMSRANARAV